mgnify:CR=1 FL=1
MDLLEPSGISFKTFEKFRGIPSKIPCFPENLVTGKISFRIRYDSYIGILRPFGTISEVFEKNSAERSAEYSVISCFPESVLKMINRKSKLGFGVV